MLRFTFQDESTIQSDRTDSEPSAAIPGHVSSGRHWNRALVGESSVNLQRSDFVMPLLVLRRTAPDLQLD